VQGGDRTGDAVARAQAAAGNREVLIVGGADTAQQALKAGMVDELEVGVPPVPSGGGTALFANLLHSVCLEPKPVAERSDTTVLRYRVIHSKGASMSFQAYLDTVKAQTGKTVADFRILAAEKGLSKHGEIVKWLKVDFALGHGHATAITAALLKPEVQKTPQDDRVNAIFSGKKALWRDTYEALLKAVNGFGDDVKIAPTDTYVSLLREPKRGKIAIVQPGATFLDLGIKRKGVEATPRFGAAGSWNSMVTHRVRITDASQIDAEVLDWLEQAYQNA
jgi:hypothetical protein